MDFPGKCGVIFINRFVICFSHHVIFMQRYLEFDKYMLSLKITL
jgi:hypothetical protein